MNRSTRSRPECRRTLGLRDDDARRAVLVSFGGFGSGRFRGSPEEDLSSYVFVGLEPGAPQGFPGEWIVLGRPSPVAHEDLMRACDAVIGKAGFSTVAEALAHDTRFLYLPRAEFPEVPVLEDGLKRHGCARAMPRADFDAGRWRAHLDALFRQPAASQGLPCDGADRIAETLLGML